LTGLAEKLDAASARGLALHDVWVRRRITLARVENALSNSTFAILSRGLRQAHRRLLDDPDPPGRWKLSHKLNWLTVDLHTVHQAMCKHVEDQTGPLVRAWFAMQARSLIHRVRPRDHESIKTHVASLGVSHQLGEAKKGKGFTINVKLDKTEILKAILSHMDTSEIAAYLRSPSATAFRGRANQRLKDAMDRLAKEMETAITRKAKRAAVGSRIRSELNRLADRVDGIVRDHVQTVAYDSEDMLAQYLSPAVKRLRWTALLDARTCLKCGSLHGKVWRVSDPSRPRMPAHGHCRCYYLPVLRGSTPPPATDTYDKFLRRQSAAKQLEILGPTRYKLFRKGVPAERFVNRLRRIVPVSKLPDPGRIPKAWKQP